MSSEVLRLRWSLEAPPPAPDWPAGLGPGVFAADRAAEVHALFRDSYAERGLAFAPFAAWWRALAADRDYDPALMFLAVDRVGVVVGVAQCWTSAFVKDLAVRPDARRRGVARALMLRAFAEFRARGAAHVELKVDAGNGPARAFYAALGMTDNALADRPAPDKGASPVL